MTKEFINSQPKLGTKEFNDLASAFFVGNPKQKTIEEFNRCFDCEWIACENHKKCLKNKIK
jgi:hypothetical protein